MSGVRDPLRKSRMCRSHVGEMAMLRPHPRWKDRHSLVSHLPYSYLLFTKFLKTRAGMSVIIYAH